MLALLPNNRITTIELDRHLGNKFGVKLMNMRVPFDYLIIWHPRKKVTQCPVDGRFSRAIFSIDDQIAATDGYAFVGAECSKGLQRNGLKT